MARLQAVLFKRLIFPLNHIANSYMAGDGYSTWPRMMLVKHVTKTDTPILFWLVNQNALFWSSQDQSIFSKKNYLNWHILTNFRWNGSFPSSLKRPYSMKSNFRIRVDITAIRFAPIGVRLPRYRRARNTLRKRLPASKSYVSLLLRIDSQNRRALRFGPNDSGNWSYREVSEIGSKQPREEPARWAFMCSIIIAKQDRIKTTVLTSEASGFQMHMSAGSRFGHHSKPYRCASKGAFKLITSIGQRTT